MELTILLPCLNEALTLEKCINKALLFLKENSINGEVLVADNGSNDGSVQIGQLAGANVIHVPAKGYGAALIAGIKAAKGKYIIMGDADDSYDFSKLSEYVVKLREGNDLVMGNRFKGGIAKGAMPFLHRYLGNPVLSFTGRLFFNTPIGDFHCGLRGFTKEAALKMDLKCTGMEFASEMVVKASLLAMKIAEVPTILHKDGRDRPPHLRTWSDGWRHLRFLLMYSPNWLFLYPGIFSMLFGILFSAILILGPLKVGSVVFDVHTLLYSSLLVIIGFQSITFFVFSKIFAINEGILPRSHKLDSLLKYFNLEKGLIIGVFLLLAGLVLSFQAVHLWNSRNFGELDTGLVLRWVIPASTLIIIGIQLILYSFFYSILALKTLKD